MDSEELLQEQARLYIRLSGDPGADPERIEREFMKLKDMVIVEVYFMKAVRAIITKDEMSGFILFVEKDLRTMMDAFDPDRSCILAFLRHCMELRALSYLASVRRSRCLNSRRSIDNLMTGDFHGQPGPEDILLREDPPGEPGTAAVRLRSICAAKPSRRRSLFIFICTLLPSLTSDTVDNFCRILNIDRAQTTVIADYLADASGPAGSGRKSRQYLRQRRNYFNMRRIELESHIISALDSNPLEKKLTYQKIQLSRLGSRIAHRRMNVSYRILSELLGLDTRQIATAVHYSKTMMELVNMENMDNYTGPFRKALLLSMKKPAPEIPVFEPFPEFGITMLPEPSSPCRLAPANQLSSKHGTRQQNTACELQCAQAS